MPEWVATDPDFTCPRCHRALRSNPPVSVPSLELEWSVLRWLFKYIVPIFGSSCTGRDTSPLIFYGLFYDENKQSSIAVHFLAAQISGYFKGKVHFLSSYQQLANHCRKMNSSRWQHLSKTWAIWGLVCQRIGLQWKPLLHCMCSMVCKHFHLQLPTLFSYQAKCRLILMIQTHSSPENGGLLYKHGESASLPAVKVPFPSFFLSPTS